jgi:hypothetical protein
MVLPVLSRWLNRDSAAARRGSRRRARQPQLEGLENRIVPVLGANAFGTTVARGGDFDGVVNLLGCTGSLLSTRLEVLTAAHCVDSSSDGDTVVDGASTVRFEMIRNGNPININLNIPANLTFLHGGWADNFGQGNDLSIFRLTDQVAPAVNRRLIAPFGAQGYNLFTGNPIGQNFTVVGYGETGTGNTGQQTNEVQRVTINSPSGGTFTLTFNGQTTGNINEGSTSQQVAAALSLLGNIGAGNVVVNNENLPANTWDVRFIGLNGNQPQMTGTGSGGSSVGVTTTFDGGTGSGGTKRRGDNTYDAFRAGSAVANSILRFDFDNGLAAQNPLGGLGLGANEGLSARGDSGGPGFIFNNNEWQITTVVSFTEGPPAQDINTYVDNAGNERRDNSFGEINAETFANAHAAGFINPTLAGNFDLVLDMNQQVLGNDGLTENLTIIVRRNGANLEIEVVNNSTPGAFAGIYYSAPLATIQSLTLRGSGDNETFRIEDDLDLNFTVDGRGGTDTLQLLNTTATYTPDGTNQPSQGTINAYTDNTIQFSNFEFVTPVAPVITSFGLNQTEINENDTATLSVDFIDPGSLSSHEVTIDWGDGTIDQFNLVVGTRSFTRDHTYLDDDPTGTPRDNYPIHITITDNDSFTDEDDTEITVNNVDPVVTTLTSSSPECGGASEGEPITIEGTFSDAGTLDTHTVLIDWGDGTPATAGVVIQGSGTGSFSGDHVYTSGGIFQITITLTDDDTGSDTATTQVLISGAGVLNGKLYVIGTNNGDQIHVNEQGTGQTKVNTDFLAASKSFANASFSQIIIIACGGGDQVNVSSGVATPTLADGGDGDDHLNGGGGRNILIGGDGADRLVANKADDLLIASGTSFTGHTVDLSVIDAILSAWNAGTAYSIRRAAATALLTPLLIEDGDADQLTGSSGQDLFFANLVGGVLDKITDLKTGEGGVDI